MSDEATVNTDSIYRAKIEFTDAREDSLVSQRVRDELTRDSKILVDVLSALTKRANRVKRTGQLADPFETHKFEWDEEFDTLDYDPFLTVTNLAGQSAAWSVWVKEKTLTSITYGFVGVTTGMGLQLVAREI